MSLVDYAASSDEDEPQIPAHKEENQYVKENPNKRSPFVVPAPAPPSNDDSVHPHSRTSENLRLPLSKKAENFSSELKLPDASFLLNSPVVPSNLLNVSDHSSRVAVAMAESAARKRELNGPNGSIPRRKVPKGTLPYSKAIPDTVGSRLLPPQLAGRSNVVTEDISKLFLKKQTNSSTG